MLGKKSLYQQQAIALGRKIKQLLAGFSEDRFGVSLMLMPKWKRDPDFFLFGFDSLVSKQSKPKRCPSESPRHIWGSRPVGNTGSDWERWTKEDTQRGCVCTVSMVVQLVTTQL